MYRRLRRLERIWLKRSKRYCHSYAAEYWGGSLYPIYYDHCWIRTTIERTLVINRFR
jgi:uncharacterized protein YecT (DUF1311 family)